MGANCQAKSLASKGLCKVQISPLNEYSAETTKLRPFQISQCLNSELGLDNTVEDFTFLMS